jgi:prepilin-type N-terminal cleavage/methylation domain-containing protein
MSRSPLRRRLAAADGFTLVETLVVILVVGALMAIAVAAFLNQRAKAQDAHAKTGATTAVTALDVYHTEHGSYDGATPAALERIEPSLRDARGLEVDADGDTFTVTVESAANAGATYSIERTASGRLIRDCGKPGTGSCADEPDEYGNRW